MSAAEHGAEIALLALGCGVTVLSTLAMLWVTELRDRLHLLSPVSSLGVPLVAAALVLANGWSLTSGQIVVIAVLAVITGPTIGMATARAGKQRSESNPETAE